MQYRCSDEERRQCLLEKTLFIANTYAHTIETAIQAHAKNGSYDKILHALQDAFDNDPNPDFQYRFGLRIHQLMLCIEDDLIPRGLATEEDKTKIRSSLARLLSYPCEPESYQKWRNEIHDELHKLLDVA